MAKTSFEFNKELAVIGKGSLLEAEQILGKVAFAGALTKVIGLYQSIDQEYRKAVGNDGKIVGKERTDILTQVDRFFNGIILAWKRLENTNSITILIENPGADFRFQINERNGIWEASGKLAPFFVRPVSNFHDIYSRKLAPEIVNLLKRYAEASEDGVIDDQERADLGKGMKQVLYYTLFLRLQLEQCFIHD